MVPVSEDAWERGPGFLYNLAKVYALTNEPSLALEQLPILVKTQGGLFYEQLKLDPALDSPRFDQLVAQLAPHEEATERFADSLSSLTVSEAQILLQS